jgi:tRNA G10  N-methylase Trm11
VEPILAAHPWRNNAELIAATARLGYIKQTDKVLDPTYGRGKWWTEFRPDDLTTHDKKLDGVDFRNLPYDPETFDVVAFDPPYVSTGGRQTTTMPDFADRYGMTDAPRTPAGLQILINDGLAEVARVTKKNGIVLCKCQNYISSGHLWLGAHWTLSEALHLGLECIDILEHTVKKPRAQPKGRRQVHARRNLSTLFVFQK